MIRHHPVIQCCYAELALVAAALMVSLTGVFIYREIKGKWQLTILITTAVSTLLAIVFLNIMTLNLCRLIQAWVYQVQPMTIEFREISATQSSVQVCQQ